MMRTAPTGYIRTRKAMMSPVVRVDHTRRWLMLPVPGMARPPDYAVSRPEPTTATSARGLTTKASFCSNLPPVILPCQLGAGPLIPSPCLSRPGDSAPLYSQAPRVSRGDSTWQEEGRRCARADLLTQSVREYARLRRWAPEEFAAARSVAASSRRGIRSSRSKQQPQPR